MGKRIVLRYSDDVPASPDLRYIEKIALADRRSLRCRFGEPCDPRKLIKLYDVCDILETYEAYEAHYERSLNGEFKEIPRWSGVAIDVGNGVHLIMANPDNHHVRRTLTISHEFGHLALGHRPIWIDYDREMPETRYSDAQEIEAYVYGLAILLPYAPLLQMLEQGASIRGIAHHYAVSVPAVEFRLKVTGLWEMQ
jgi:hypothetical protein